MAVVSSYSTTNPSLSNSNSLLSPYSKISNPKGLSLPLFDLGLPKEALEFQSICISSVWDCVQENVYMMYEQVQWEKD